MQQRECAELFTNNYTRKREVEALKSSSRSQNTIYNLITGMGGQAIQIILKFVTRTVFIHILGQAYLGVNGLFSDILTLLSMTELGFDTAINYRLYKPLANKDYDNVRLIVKLYRRVYLSVGLAILVMGLCITPFLPVLIKDYETLAELSINAVLIYFIYLAQSVLSYMFLAYKAAVVKADQRGYILEIAHTVINLVSNIVQIIVLIATRDFVVYTCVLLIFTVITNLVNGIIAKRLYPDVFRPERNALPKDDVLNIFKDCGALFIYKVNGVVTRATDNLVLSAFIGIMTVGLYSNYLLIYNTLNTLLNRFYEACKASMGNLFAVSKTEDSYFFFEVMNYLTFILYGTACVGIGVLSNDVIGCWLGENYLMAQPIPALLGILILFSGIRNNLGQVRNVTGAFRQMWYRPLMGIIINIVVSVVLVQWMGIPGVLIGTITANVLTNFFVDPRIIYKYSFKQFRKVSDYYKNNLGYMGILGVIFIIDYILCNLIIQSSTLFIVLLKILICGLSVPTMYIAVYRKSEPAKYTIRKIRGIARKSLEKLGRARIRTKR